MLKLKPFVIEDQVLEDISKLSTTLAYITLCANSGLCFAINPKAHAAASFTPVSNSSKHPTNGSSASF